MVVRGLIEKPARIDTPLGTLAEVGNYFTPKLSRRILHQLYLGYPDSAAARGVAQAQSPSSGPPSSGPTSSGPTSSGPSARRRPRRPARAVARMRVLRPVTRPVKRAVRMVPGVHW
jgi:hypothetical protein